MATCAHTSIFFSILWCLYCHELSSLSFDSQNLHEDEIVFCPAISRMNCIFHHICFLCMKLCLNICYLSHFFHICLYDIFLSVIFHFSSFTSALFEKI